MGVAVRWRRLVTFSEISKQMLEIGSSAYVTLSSELIYFRRFGHKYRLLKAGFLKFKAAGNSNLP